MSQSLEQQKAHEDHLIDLAPLAPDGELTEDWDDTSSPTLQTEKKKRDMELSVMEIIYQRYDAEKLRPFVGEIENCLNLNTILQEKVKEFRGCKLTLDCIYYLPTILFLLRQLLFDTVDAGTVELAGIILVSSAALMVILNMLVDDDERTWSVYRARKKEVASAREDVTTSAKKLRAYFRVLSIPFEAKKSGQPKQFMELVREISNFFEEKKLDQEAHQSLHM